MSDERVVAEIIVAEIIVDETIGGEIIVDELGLLCRLPRVLHAVDQGGQRQ